MSGSSAGVERPSAAGGVVGVGGLGGRIDGEPRDAAVPAAQSVGGAGIATSLLRFAPVLVAAPALVAAISAVAQGWVPASDQAIEVLRVADVGTRHTPLVGPWSRYGWDHPGPLLFWLSAPAYRLLGDVGVPATTAVINGAAAAGAVVAARRVGGTELGWLVAAVTAVLGAAMGDALADPWNPFVGVLPLLAFLVCAWGASKGQGPLLIGAVAAGSYCVQSHVGFLPVVASASAFGVLHVIVRRRRGAAVDTVGRRAVIAALGLGLALWSGPLTQQVTGATGNLGELIRYVQAGADDPVGWEDAVRVAGRQFGIPAPWMGAADHNPSGVVLGAPPWSALAVLGVAVALGIVAWRRGHRARGMFVAYAVGLTGLSVIAMSRIEDFLAPYLVRWAWPVAALVWVAAAWAGLAAARRDDLTRAVVGASMALAVVAATLTALDLGSVELPFEREGATIEAFSARAREELDPGGRYRLVILDPGFGVLGTGLAADLRLQGWDVRVPPQYTSFEDREIVPEADRLPTLFVVTLVGRDPWEPPPGAELIDSYDPLTVDQRRVAGNLEGAILADIGSAAPATLDLRNQYVAEDVMAAGADPDDVRRLADLQGYGRRSQLWLAPAWPGS